VSPNCPKPFFDILRLRFVSFAKSWQFICSKQLYSDLFVVDNYTLLHLFVLENALHLLSKDMKNILPGRLCSACSSLWVKEFFWAKLYSPKRKCSFFLFAILQSGRRRFRCWFAIVAKVDRELTFSRRQVEPRVVSRVTTDPLWSKLIVTKSNNRDNCDKQTHLSTSQVEMSEPAMNSLSATKGCRTHGKSMESTCKRFQCPTKSARPPTTGQHAW